MQTYKGGDKMVFRPNALYCCKTCKTIYITGSIPLISQRRDMNTQKTGKLHPLLTAEEARKWAHLIELHTEPYWRNRAGVMTTQNTVNTMKKFATWREKHKCHHVFVVNYNEEIPSGYTEELLNDPPVKP